MEQRYTVTQTAEILGVRASVLRYWEEELELRIGRNEQGHRYYTGNDITLLGTSSLIARKASPLFLSSFILLFKYERQIIQETEKEEK